MTMYDFRPVRSGDLTQLRKWQARPHVQAWWGDDYLRQDDLDDARVLHWIVYVGGRPFAFMQDYDVHGWDPHHFGYLPKGARGIDQYIGVPEMIGIGQGSAFIRQRVQMLFTGGVPAVGTDPHPDNRRAIAAYQKAGFQVAGPAQDTQWGRILPMEAHPS